MRKQNLIVAAMASLSLFSAMSHAQSDADLMITDAMGTDDEW